ncbi:MAG: type II secretion system protein GspE, partial [Gammaproteobacteria bacterium]
MNALRFAYAKRYGVLVVDQDESAVKVIYHQTPSLKVLAEMRRHLQLPLKLEWVSDDVFNQQLVKTYETNSTVAMQMAENLGEAFNLSDLMQELPRAEDLLDKQDDAPIIRLLNALLSEAIKDGASDVHIETFENHVTIRFRVDGILREVLEPPRVLAPLIVSRIKVMAKLDIAEKRLPQDGRITLHIGGRAVDVRVSIMPTNHGERAVLRLLDKQSARLDLAELGMAAPTLALLQSLVVKPHGILLVTGPTGSGKTTTLYAVNAAYNV